MSKIHTELFMGKMYIWDLLQNNMGGEKWGKGIGETKMAVN